MVFESCQCEDLGDYHDLYLKTDTLLLACVGEEFRSVCYKTYGLDSAHYYTCSHLSGDAFLKICKADVELLTDREHLEMVEDMIRGGVSSVFVKSTSKQTINTLIIMIITSMTSMGFCSMPTTCMGE